MLIIKSEYNVALAGGTEKKIIASSIVDVCKELEEDDEIISIVKDHVVEQYEVPEQVMVNVAVDSIVSHECGCKVYPSKSTLMNAGDTIVLTAVAADGWKFKEWILGDTVVSTEMQTLITVPQSDGTGVVTYAAVFTSDFS